MPDKVEYGASNYLKVFENAVKSSMLKPQDIDELKKIQEVKFEADAKKNIEEMIDLPKAIKEIKKLMKEKLTSKKIDNQFIVDSLSEYEYSTPDDIRNTDIAKKILDKFTNA